MIVDPDFLEHWKTRMLAQSLGGDCEDPCAPLYLLRLWAHCQRRKKCKFDNLNSAALKALCCYSGHANKLESSLIASGFVRREDNGELTVCSWDEYNAKLIASWENGTKGGRPKKTSGNKNLNKTHGFSTGIPWETDGKPTDNPQITDKSRLDKNGFNKLKPLSSKSLDDAKLVLDYLNKKSGHNYRPVSAHLEAIQARLKDKEVTVPGIQQMIDAKCAEWRDDPNMAKYLRPQTLFNRSKFAGYYDTRTTIKINGTSHEHNTGGFFKDSNDQVQ